MAKSGDKVKQRRWERLLREKQSSRQSVAAFCRARRIPVHQFYWWQRQLRYRKSARTSTKPSNDATFVSVRVPIHMPSIELVHPSGCVIRVATGVDARSLRNVLDALQPTEE